ncbi:MAG: type II toxin-antitoxin system VapC family toxin [Thermoleophilia bacterium]|jgi:predicted nucleic acid-binding protein|nr:type II toxin-antitoxin system VapC family toxin [Thermoleophilia bacterium]
MSAEEIAYLDSSALVKLVLREDESGALRAHLDGSRVAASSELARTEVVRAVRGTVAPSVPAARALVEGLVLVELGAALLTRAADLDPITLRSLDAIHLASAEQIGAAEVITYDRRMADAARALGLTVRAPGAVLG